MYRTYALCTRYNRPQYMHIYTVRTYIYYYKLYSITPAGSGLELSRCILLHVVKGD